MYLRQNMTPATYCMYATKNMLTFDDFIKKRSNHYLKAFGALLNQISENLITKKPDLPIYNHDHTIVGGCDCDCDCDKQPNQQASTCTCTCTTVTVNTDS